MTAARVSVAGVLVLAVAVVAFLLLRGSGGHEYHLLFQNAGQLVNDDDVQVGGRRIGAVEKIELTDDNQAEVTVKIDDELAPLHEGTTAIIRQASLSGVANRYIALLPGPNSAPTLDDGSTLTAEKTTTPVDLDELFNTFDPKTREGLKQFIRGSSAQYAGKGKEANEALKYFNPAFTSGSEILQQIAADQPILKQFVDDSSKLVTALAARKASLGGLVQHANETAGAIADENTSLEKSLDLLPGTLRKSNTTFVNLRSTLDDLDQLTDASKPAAKVLAPFLKKLRPLLANARPTVANIRKLVSQPGSSNDLTELLQDAPALAKVGTKSFTNTQVAIQGNDPKNKNSGSIAILRFIRPYTTDLVGFIDDFGQGAANYDANGHYVRVSPLFNSLKVGSDGALTTNDSRDATAAGGFVTGQNARCPGAATQQAPDGSNPWQQQLPTDQGGKIACDPTMVIPDGK